MNLKFYYLGFFVLISATSIQAQCLYPGSIGYDDTVCYNGNPDLLVSVYDAFGNPTYGTITYQWQYSPNGTSGWVSISGANATTYNPPSGLTSERWYRRRATNRCASLYTNVVNIALHDELFAGGIDGDQTICSGGNPSLLTNAASATGGNGTISYQWQYSPNGTGSWTAISGATSISYDPPSGLTDDRWYRREASDDCGSVYTDTVKVTIAVLNSGSISGNQIICFGGNPSLLTNAASATGGIGTISYKWQYSANGTGSWTDILGATSISYDPPNGLTDDRWYRRVATDDCNLVYSNTIKVTVDTGCRTVPEYHRVEVGAELKIYPNPLDVNQKLNISVPEIFSNGMLEITDLSGHVVYDQILKESSLLHLHLRLSSGVYIVRLTSGKDQIHSKIIVKN